MKYLKVNMHAEIPSTPWILVSVGLEYMPVCALNYCNTTVTGWNVNKLQQLK
jgi:hypothetical protein